MASMSDEPSPPDNGASAAIDAEMSDALRAGLRQAGYHVMRAGYELLAGVSAFLEAVGGVGDDDEAEPILTQRIEVE